MANTLAYYDSALWPTGIWPTGIWPTGIWPTGIWSTQHGLSSGRQFYFVYYKTKSTKCLSAKTFSVTRHVTLETWSSMKIEKFMWDEAGNPYWWGQLSTIYLHVPTSLSQPIFILRIYVFLFNKTSYHNKEVKRIEPSLSVRVPWIKGQRVDVIPLKNS